jgi:DNA-binding NarL/FixJ family response regulator
LPPTARRCTTTSPIWPWPIWQPRLCAPNAGRQQTVLQAALKTCWRLGAAPWARRAQAELRACGVTAQAAPPAPGALTELTAQQREIVILAGRGLSNSEIADRMFLSPRTVASHLYRSFPKLGVADRHQLRDLLDQQQDQ